MKNKKKAQLTPNQQLEAVMEMIEKLQWKIEKVQLEVLQVTVEKSIEDRRKMYEKAFVACSRWYWEFSIWLTNDLAFEELTAKEKPLYEKGVKLCKELLSALAFQWLKSLLVLNREAQGVKEKKSMSQWWELVLMVNAEARVVKAKQQALVALVEKMSEVQHVKMAQQEELVRVSNPYKGLWQRAKKHCNLLAMMDPQKPTGASAFFQPNKDHGIAMRVRKKNLKT